MGNPEPQIALIKNIVDNFKNVGDTLRTYDLYLMDKRLILICEAQTDGNN